jgi:prolyl-tRNA synthetase
MSTRIIGGIIMTHGDNNGLVIPPRIAPIQAIVLPIAAHKPGVTEAAEAVVERLKAVGIRAKGDFSDNSAGWKFAQYEMKGVPLRIEIGPKDLEKGQFVAARRDNGEKVFLPLDELETAVAKLLDDVHDGLFAKAKQNLDSHIWPATTVEEVKEKAQDGFVKTMWCGDTACEEKMKELAGVSSRCIPFEQENLGDVCPCCGKPAKHMVIWGIAY